MIIRVSVFIESVEEKAGTTFCGPPPDADDVGVALTGTFGFEFCITVFVLGFGLGPGASLLGLGFTVGELTGAEEGFGEDGMGAGPDSTGDFTFSSSLGVAELPMNCFILDLIALPPADLTCLVVKNPPG